MNNLLSIRDLQVRFRAAHGRWLHAVDGVSLDIREGEVLGLVGESGSGKSTLGRALLGLQPRSSGYLTYAGRPLPMRFSQTAFRRQAREAAMIFQDPLASLNPRMRVFEILEEPLLLRRIADPGERRRHAEQWLQRVGLAPQYGERYPKQLSGGQRQRVGIARALIGNPRFVVCDEAFSALDVSIRAQIVALLAQLRRELDLTLLFISHDLALVSQIADRVAVMYMGAIVETGPAQGVLSEPMHPYTQSLVAACPRPDPVREKLRAHTPMSGEIGAPLGPACGCRFAPRCALAQAPCHREVPRLLPIENHSAVSCLRVQGLRDR